MNMKEFIGLCYIGVSPDRTQYALLRFARDQSNGVSFLYPPIISISQSEMAENGLATILTNLRNVPTLDSTLTPNIPKNEWQRLKRTHLLVDVALLRSNGGKEEIEIKPLHAKRGGRFDIEPNEIRVFQLPITNEIFLKALDDALEIAT